MVKTSWFSHGNFILGILKILKSLLFLDGKITVEDGFFSVLHQKVVLLLALVSMGVLWLLDAHMEIIQERLERELI